MALVKMGILIAAVLAIGLAGQAIVRYFRRRTIASWGGRGVNDALAPWEAALLVGLHPGAIMAIYFDHLRRLRRVRLVEETPITVEWAEGRALEELEPEFQDAFDEQGRLHFPGIRAFLDALFKIVNTKMSEASGLKSSTYYEHLAAELWEQMRDGDHPEPAAFPWLLLLDANDIWDQIGRGEGWQVLRDVHRVKERFRAELYDMDELRESAREATSGFFKYRRDLATREERETEVVGGGLNKMTYWAPAGPSDRETEAGRKEDETEER